MSKPPIICCWGGPGFKNTRLSPPRMNVAWRPSEKERRSTSMPLRPLFNNSLLRDNFLWRAAEDGEIVPAGPRYVPLLHGRPPGSKIKAERVVPHPPSYSTLKAAESWEEGEISLGVAVGRVLPVSCPIEENEVKKSSTPLKPIMFWLVYNLYNPFNKLVMLDHAWGNPFRSK